jgi:hypothetical protein
MIGWRSSFSEKAMLNMNMVLVGSVVAVVALLACTAIYLVIESRHDTA